MAIPSPPDFEPWSKQVELCAKRCDDMFVWAIGRPRPSRDPQLPVYAYSTLVRLIDAFRESYPWGKIFEQVLGEARRNPGAAPSVYGRSAPSFHELILKVSEEVLEITASVVGCLPKASFGPEGNYEYELAGLTLLLEDYGSSESGEQQSRSLAQSPRAELRKLLLDFPADDLDGLLANLDLERRQVLLILEDTMKKQREDEAAATAALKLQESVDDIAAGVRTLPADMGSEFRKAVQPLKDGQEEDSAKLEKVADGIRDLNHERSVTDRLRQMLAAGQPWPGFEQLAGMLECDEGAVQNVVQANPELKRWADPLSHLSAWVKRTLNGKQRRLMELLILEEGGVRLADLAIDPVIDWQSPWDNVFKSVQTEVNKKMDKAGHRYKVKRENNTAFLKEIGQNLGQK